MTLPLSGRRHLAGDRMAVVVRDAQAAGHEPETSEDGSLSLVAQCAHCGAVWAIDLDNLELCTTKDARRPCDPMCGLHELLWRLAA